MYLSARVTTYSHLREIKKKNFFHQQLARFWHVPYMQKKKKRKKVLLFSKAVQECYGCESPSFKWYDTHLYKNIQYNTQTTDELMIQYTSVHYWIWYDSVQHGHALIQVLFTQIHFSLMYWCVLGLTLLFKHLFTVFTVSENWHYINYLHSSAGTHISLKRYQIRKTN